VCSNGSSSGGSLSDGVKPKNERSKSISSLDSARIARAERLVQWHVETLLGMIPSIVAKRENADGSVHCGDGDGGSSLYVSDEAQETPRPPRFRSSRRRLNPKPEKSIVLSSKVESQLYEYITEIAAMYRGKEKPDGTKWSRSEHV
jgi:hypothetical protein